MQDVTLLRSYRPRGAELETKVTAGDDEDAVGLVVVSVWVDADGLQEESNQAVYLHGVSGASRGQTTVFR